MTSSEKRLSVQDVGEKEKLLSNITSGEVEEYQPNQVPKTRFQIFVAKWKQELDVLLLMGLVIALGAGNRLTGKIMTEPMDNYSFFLGLWNGLMYCILYFSILYYRHRKGMFDGPATMRYVWNSPPPIERGDMSYIRWKWESWPIIKYFIVMGAMDGLGNLLGLIATPYISGPLNSLMSQAITPFSMICSMIILGDRYTFWQSASAGIVLSGAVVCLIPQFTGDDDDDDDGDDSSSGEILFFSLVMAVSTLPNAISFALKELVFIQKPDLELFVVNSHASLFQLLWWPVFLPMTLIPLLNQTDDQSLPDYVYHGFQCFFSITPDDGEDHDPDCSSMPIPYLVYIVFNLSFNIFLLILLRRASSLLGFLTIKAILPVSVLLFYFDWPLIGSTSISIYYIIGLFIVMVGLFAYRYFSIMKTLYPDYERGKFCCSTMLVPLKPKKAEISEVEEEQEDQDA